MEPIYEGKAKRLFTTDDPNVLRMEYKDSATAFNGVKKEDFENKGRFNKAITLIIYRMLEARGVETHLVDDVDDINLLVKKVSIIPLEVIVRNVAAGSFSKRMGVTEGTAFKKPIVEFSYKDDSLGDPFINDDYAREMGAA
ncbi:MAG: phosphoribosylaminoimidazolesuccinocarboxamide synthase, partial [Akkermansia sp.]|nr:phosphoribosylaminoimidazolesuccinocarboxamide synthase [Akkermansia sp.]